jgi:tetratricopeptide (TPR) repeat protein
MERLRTLPEIAAIQTGVARTYAMLGDAEQAESFAVKARSLSRKLTLPKHEAVSWLVVGILRREAGRLREAARCFERAERLVGEEDRLWCWRERSRLLALQGQAEAARALAARAVSGARGTGDPYQAASGLLVNAELLAEDAADAAARGRALADEAAELTRRVGYRELSWQLDRLRARLAQATGREREAALLWDAAYATLSGIVEDIQEDRLRYLYVQKPRCLEVLRQGRPRGGKVF